MINKNGKREKYGVSKTAAGIFAFVVFLIFISVPAACALELYDLDSFGNKTMQGIKLGEGEGVQFNLFGGKHLVIVDNIDGKANTTNLEVFVFSKKIMKLTFREGVKLRLDVDRDGTTDMIVHILKVTDTPEKKVTLIFEDTSTDKPEVTGSAVENIKKESRGKVIKESPSKTLTLIAVMVLALSFFLYSRKRNSSRRKNSRATGNKAAAGNNGQDSVVSASGKGEVTERSEREDKGPYARSESESSASVSVGSVAEDGTDSLDRSDILEGKR